MKKARIRIEIVNEGQRELFHVDFPSIYHLRAGLFMALNVLAGKGGEVCFREPTKLEPVRADNQPELVAVQEVTKSATGARAAKRRGRRR